MSNNTIDFQWDSGSATPPKKESAASTFEHTAPRVTVETPRELEELFVIAPPPENFEDELTSFFQNLDGAKNDSISKTPTSAPPAQTQQQPLTLRINDKKTLYAMWISVFKSGGLFIPKEQLSGKTFCPGDSMMFRLSLPDDPARAVLLGVKMAWETPTYSESRMTAGIGFAFDASDVAEAVKQRAERILTDVPLNTPNFTI